MPEIAALANPDPVDQRLIFGCGYLGRRVAALWLAQGRRVIGVTRSKADEVRACGVEPIVADVTQPFTLKALPDCGTTLYCVGFDRGSGQPMRKVYVDGLANVVRRCQLAGGSFMWAAPASTAKPAVDGSMKRRRQVRRTRADRSHGRRNSYCNESGRMR